MSKQLEKISEQFETSVQVNLDETRKITNVRQLDILLCSKDRGMKKSDTSIKREDLVPLDVLKLLVYLLLLIVKDL